MTDTNKMRKLLDAATPLPWAVSYGDDMWRVVQTKAAFHGRLLARSTAFDDGSAGGEYGPSCTGATRDLIVAAVNALPALLDELDAAHEAIRMERERTQKAEAEVERLRDEAAKWHNLLPVYEDAEREVQQLRADLREAMELLMAHGEPPKWMREERLCGWNRRYYALLAKHKETP